MNAAEQCAHCELPLGRRFANATVGGREQRFCCYGCVLAHQVTRASGEPGAAATILVRLGLGIFCAMNVMAFSLPTYAQYIYGDGAFDADGPLFQVLRLLSAAFALPVIVLLGGPIVLAAGRSLRLRMLTADSLIVLGASAAYGLSLFHTMRGRGEVYFDTAAMLLVIVTIGRYLEAKAKADAGALVRASLSPGPATAVRLVGTGVQEVPALQLVPGDVVRVTPGDAFATDGLVLQGEGGVDEAALTGESRAVAKGVGSRVAGGTCSIDGTFTVLVSARQSESATARIAALLAQAMRQRGRMQRLADRAARLMIPAVLAVALLTGVGWALAVGVERALMCSLAVLVVACPCALGIATPAAMWMGLLAAARRGVVVRTGVSLERAARISRVLFDKTGTLTTRLPALERVLIAPGRQWSAERALAVAAALEAHVNHPLAQAVVAAARNDRSEPVPDVVDPQVIPGKGVRGQIGGQKLAIGSVAFAASDHPDAAMASWLQQTPPASIVSWDDAGPIAAFSFRELPHPSASAAVARLRHDGIAVGLVSGDHHLEAIVPRYVAAADAYGGLSAADKLAHVHTQRQIGPVAMVGDGLNDAPALAAADLGVAVCAATDLTRVSADILVMDDDLTHVPWILAHARRVRRVMLQNLCWAGGYNLVAVGMAAMGVLNPLVAAVIMVVSSVLVVANARRLLRPAPGLLRDSREWEDQLPVRIDLSNERETRALLSRERERHDP